MLSTYTGIQNISAIKSSNLYISGLVVTCLSTEITISPGECRDSTNSCLILSKNTISLNPNKIGINGNDNSHVPSSPQGDVLYSVYCIGDSSGFNSTASIMTPTFNEYMYGNPVMPSGYDIKRLVGYVISNASGGTFFKSFTFGEGNSRKLFLNENYFSILLGRTSSTVDSINLNYLLPYVDQTPMNVYMSFQSSTVGGICTVNSNNYYSQSGTEILSLNINPYSNLVSDNISLSYGTQMNSDSLSLYMQGFDYCI